MATGCTCSKSKVEELTLTKRKPGPQRATLWVWTFPWKGCSVWFHPTSGFGITVDDFCRSWSWKNQPMIGKSSENHCAAWTALSRRRNESRIPERLNRKEHGKPHGNITVHKVPTANKHQKKTSCVYKSVRIRILYVHNRSDLETSPRGSYCCHQRMLAIE